jgi:hypothetical protein
VTESQSASTRIVGCPGEACPPRLNVAGCFCGSFAGSSAQDRRATEIKRKSIMVPAIREWFAVFFMAFSLLYGII